MFLIDNFFRRVTSGGVRLTRFCVLIYYIFFVPWRGKERVPELLPLLFFWGRIRVESCNGGRKFFGGVSNDCWACFVYRFTPLFPPPPPVYAGMLPPLFPPIHPHLSESYRSDSIWIWISFSSNRGLEILGDFFLFSFGFVWRW